MGVGAHFWLTLFQILSTLLQPAASQTAISLSQSGSVTDIQLFEPAHYDSHHLYGSSGGGTRIRLLGNNLLNPDGSFDTSIVVTVAGAQATLIPFLSTSKQLVVDTPAKPSGISDCCHSVRVYNKDGEVFNSVLQKRQFRYSMDYTPYIHGIVPSSAAPGEEVEILGSYRWSRLYMSYYDDDPRELVRSVTIGPARCTLPWSDDPEGAELENYYSSLPCTIPEDAAPGYYNATVTIADAFGTALPWKPYFELSSPGYGSAYSINTYWPALSRNSSIQMMQVLAAIDSVDMRGRSLAGGQTIYIKGRGFGKEKSAIQVSAGGVPCMVKKAEGNEIVCILAPGNHTRRTLYQGGAGVNITYLRGSNESTSKVVSTMNMPQQWEPYHVKMDTVFTAPFTGVGYFVANSDDDFKMWMTKLGEYGQNVSSDDLILDTPYTRRSWFLYDGQQSRDIPFLKGEQYLLHVDHVNSDGPGHLDVALVHRDAPSSWSSQKGEQHRLFVKANFYGEQQQLDLGPVSNGSFYLEIAYTNAEGYPEISRTESIDVTDQAWEIDGIMARAGLKVRTNRNATASGHVVLKFGFTRPSFDGNGYLVTLKGFNVTCTGDCTAKSGMLADVITKEDDYDWGAQVLLAWNGWNSTSPIPVHLIDSERSSANSELLFALQATSAIPMSNDKDARQDNGALRARVYGNVFDGAEIVFTWPAAMGPVTYPQHAQQSSGGHLNNGTVQDDNASNSTADGLSYTILSNNVGEFSAKTARDEAITDAWYHPIESSVFSVPGAVPQVVVHVNGLRSMCVAVDGCNSAERSIADTPIITNANITGETTDRIAVITGSGFGDSFDLTGFLPPVEIGSVQCAPVSWSDTEIQCELETPLLPGSNVVKVNIPYKGYAAEQSGSDFVIYTPLAMSISATAAGGLGGGWPVEFHSPSQQLGSESSKLYVKFTTVSSYVKSPVEVYMFPHAHGDTSSMSVLVCTRVPLGEDAPVPTLFGLEPAYFDNDEAYDDNEYAIRDYHDASDGYYAAPGSAKDQAQMDDGRTVAANFGVPNLPDQCIYFKSSSLSWSLDSGKFTVPAPPRQIFDTLKGYEYNDDRDTDYGIGPASAPSSESHNGSSSRYDGSAAMRRLQQSGEGPAADSPVVAELYLNTMPVTSSSVVYGEDSGPVISGVTPAIVSAAVPEIITVQGQGFSGDIDNTRVWVGGKECYVRSTSNSEIVCRARGGGTFGRLPVAVSTGGEYASGNFSVTGVLHIESISQHYGSVAGGSIIEIEGNGFADDDGIITTNFVSIGLPPAAPCRVLSASRTRIICQTEPAGRMHAGASEEYLNPLEVSVSGIYAQCLAPPVCAPGCDPSLGPGRPNAGFYGDGDGQYGGTGGRYGQPTASGYGMYGGHGTFAGSSPNRSPGTYGAGSYGGYGTYGGYGSPAFAGACCPFDVPDPLSIEPLAFIGDDQGYGADNCAFYYTRHATPNITAISPHTLTHGTLQIEGSGLGHIGISVYLIPMAESEVDRWMNPYRQAMDPPEAIKLPDMWSPDGVDHLMLQLDLQTSSKVVALVPRDVEAGTYLPVIWSQETGAGQYAISSNTFGATTLPLVRVHPRIEEVQPPALTSSGGMITIIGAGFPSEVDLVRVEGKGGRWIVLEASPTMITAYTPRWLYADGPSLAMSVKGIPDEDLECEIAQEMCTYYAEAASWDMIIEPETRVSSVYQEAPGAPVMVSIEKYSGGTVATDKVLANRTVQVMFGPDIVPAEIDATAGNVTITRATLANLPASPAEGHTMVILIDGMAAAGQEPRIHVPLRITSISSNTGSLMGGHNLQVSGSGFSDIPGMTQVSICDVPCNLPAQASASFLECATSTYWMKPAPMSTHAVLPVTTMQVTGTGTTTDQSRSPASNLFDGQVGVEHEWRSSTSGTCEFVVDWFPHVAQTSLVRILIPAELAARGTIWEPHAQLSGLTVDVSNDSVSWEQVADGASAAPFATGWTELNIDTSDKHRYMRMRINKSGGDCIISEVEFIGVTQPVSGPENCNVTITVLSHSGSATVYQENAYSYSEAVTPVVTDVTPRYGSAAGGTSLTISGKNLPQTTEDAVVDIDGVACVVLSASQTTLTCLTGERPGIPEKPSFTVYSLSHGAAMLGDTAFAYKDLWSSRVTWAGEPVPREGESVVIPAGQTILFDLKESPKLRLLLVEGRLEFLDTHDLELHAEWIMVRGAGSALTVGREDQPFTHHAAVTLHGRRDTAREIPSYGAKNIAVRYGTLDLHGSPKTPTWTKLGITAMPGHATVVLAEPVNWQANDEVAIASSAWGPHESEQRRIVSVSADGLTLTLDKALQFEHWGELVEMAGRTIDMRAEIGCLSRNVLIQGDDESDTDQYGAHIMLSSPPRGRLATTIGRISQIECFRCGQAFMLGRYPLHFHMMGDVHDSYIRGAAVHRTFNRAVTVHGVHYLRIEDVVAFDNMGHTFFIEDAIESQNRIVHNLALWTRKSMSLLDTDTTPASFWITFPTNYFYNNSAAGSERYGFWFDLQRHPTGPSHTTDICPPGEPLGAFEDNTAHSNVRYGLRVFNFWVPLDSSQSPCQWSSSWAQRSPRTANLLRYTGYKNGRTGLMLSRAGDVRCTDCALVDNMRAGAELNRMDSPYGTTGTYDTLIGINSPAMASQKFPHHVRDDPDSPRTYGWIVSGYTNEQVVTDTTFVGFMRPDGFAFSTCDHCNFPNSQNQGAKTTHFVNISYVDTDSYVHYGPQLNAILHDMDGTMSGYPAGTYLTHSGWPHLTATCPIGQQPGWTTSAVCPLTKRLIRLAVDQPSPYSVFQNKNMIVQHAEQLSNTTLLPELAGKDVLNSLVPWGNAKKKQNSNGWAVVLASDEHYHLWWSNANPIPDRYRFEVTDMLAKSRANSSLPEAVHITMPYLDVWGYIGVTGLGKTRVPNDTVLPDVSLFESGDSYRNYDNNTLSMLLSGRENPEDGWWWNQRLTVRGQVCPPEGCPPPEDVAPDRDDVIRKWSDPKIWDSLPESERPQLDPATGQPAAGASVSIPSEWVIQLDTDTAPLGHLELDGLLTFAVGKAVTLTAESVKMSVGAIVAGNATHPHNGTVTLQFRNSEVAKPSAQLASARRLYVGGDNVVQCLGDISLHGTSSLPQSTHLRATATPGDTVIYLTEDAYWQTGEEVFLTSTGLSWEEAEYATVAECTGSSCTLKEPLRFEHFGRDDIFRDDTISSKTKYSGLENRAQVLLLTRSITVEGAGLERDGAGAKLFISELEVEREERGLPIKSIYRGSLDIDNVAFRGMGQTGTGRAALTIESTSNETAIHNCTFSHGFGPGIEVRMAELVQITDSVVIDTQGPAIAIWNDRTKANGKPIPAQTKAIILRNTAGFARKLGVDVRLDTVSGFVLCPYATGCTIQAEHNVAAGSENYGFVFGMAGSCGVDDSSVGANTAHSCRVGFVYLSEASPQCSRVSNAIAHHTTEVGVVYDRGGVNMEVEHLLLSDNRIGLAVMPGTMQDSGHVNISRTAAIGFSKDGATSFPGCGYKSVNAKTATCPSDGACRQEREYGWPNYSENGGSACGSRIGILTSVWFNKPKPWPRTVPLMGPWTDVDADASLGGFTYMSDIALVNWFADDNNCECGHFAISPNPTADDLTPTAFSRSVAQSGVDNGAQYWAPRADPSRATFDNCVDFECTGLHHSVLVDLDGSLVGTPASVICGLQQMNSSLPRTISDSRAKPDPRMDAIVIPGASYREIHFESLDPDRMTRRVHPVSVEGTQLAPNGFTLNSFEDHLWDFDYTSLLRMSRFATTVELGGAYSITFAGTPPQQQQLVMSGNLPDEGVLFRIKYSVAQTFKIQVKGEPMQLPSVMPVTLSDPAGANHWDMATFELTVVAKGSQPILIKQLPMIRISMALEMSVEQFLETPRATFTTGLAFALNLDPSTIRVTGYKARGSRRRLSQTRGIDLTYSIIPKEFLQEDSPPPPPAVPPPPYPPGYVAPPPTQPPPGGSPSTEPSTGGETFNIASLLSLAKAVKEATAAVKEIEIAGVTISTASLVTEVQEPVPPQCTPSCKTAENGVNSTCVDSQCMCEAAGYVYYDATSEGLAATKPSGCYENFPPPPPPYPANTPYPPPNPPSPFPPPPSPSPPPSLPPPAQPFPPPAPLAQSPPPPGAPPQPPGAVSRPAITSVVRFTNMTIDQVSTDFTDALCNVAKARIRAALDGPSAASPTPLTCSVSITSGSVIAAATVVLPASVGSAAIAAAISDLAANLGSDISGNALLAALGPFDAPVISQTTVSVVPADVAPIIGDEAMLDTLQPPTTSLPTQTGSAVILQALFVNTTEVGGIIRRTTASVTGFAADDVIASVALGTTTLPVMVTVDAWPPMAYNLSITPTVDAWSAEALESCDEWTLTVSVRAGAALTKEGDSTAASIPSYVPWRPGPDELCGETDSDNGNGLALGLGIGGAVGLVAILAVAFVAIRTRRNEMRYLNEAASDLGEQYRV